MTVDKLKKRRDKLSDYIRQLTAELNAAKEQLAEINKAIKQEDA